MHYFMQQKSKRSLHSEDLNFNREMDEQNTYQHPQPDYKYLRTIEVRKKPKLQLSNFQGQVIQTQSQSYISEKKNTEDQKQRILADPSRDKKQAPFISFMAAEYGSQQTTTPHLNFSSPYDLGIYEKNLHAKNGDQVSGQIQRNLGGKINRPIEPIEFETAIGKDLKSSNTFVRRNSLLTEFDSQRRNGTKKYPTEISFQNNEASSDFDQQIDESKPAFIMAKKNHIQISILDGKNSQQLNTCGFGDIPTSKSTKFMLRPQYFRSRNNQETLEVVSDRQEGASFSNNHIAKLAIGSRITEALKSQRSVSQFASQRQKQRKQRQKQHLNNAVIQQRPKLPAYYSYIERQNQELKLQTERMKYYADEANKLLCNADNYELSPVNMEVIVDKHYTPLKYMIEELIELFSIGEVIKYQLRYRSYEILTKIFAEASEYYQEGIKLQDPIKAYTFSLALKAILSEYEKSELDIVVTKIFQSNHFLTYDQFFEQFGSVLNSKLAALLQPESMKKQLDKTLQKVKNLFVIWIEMEYFTKKVKQILRTSKVVYDSIMVDCSSIEEPLKLDLELLEKFFLEGQRKNPIKKIKLNLFFRNLIGNDLFKSKWSDWIYKDQIRLYNRYESKLMYERKHHINKLDKQQASLNNKTCTKRDLKLKSQENNMSSKISETRKVF